MLAFALVPTLSRALAFAGGGSNWAEVCTPRGLMAVSAAGAERNPAHPVAPFDHCALCGLATEAAAPLASSATSLRVPPVAKPPDLPLHRVLPPPAWTDARPRGPPAHA